MRSLSRNAGPGHHRPAAEGECDAGQPQATRARCSRTGRARCRPSARTGLRRSSHRSSPTCGRSSSVAVRAEPVYPVPWYRGRFTSWITTVDHKRIGILYLITCLIFFGAGGILAILMRTQLAHTNEKFLSAEHYNEVMTVHGLTMVFLVIVPILAGFGNFLVPLMIGAKDVAFPRLNALSYWLFLFGGIVLYASFFADRRRRSDGLDPLSAALRAVRRQRRRPGHPLAAHPLGVVARRRDQLHRHDPPAARARDDVDARAALRLVDRRLRVDPRHRPARALGRADDAAPRPAVRDALLPAERGRERAALPARVLVLRAPRGLRDDPARDGDRLGDHPRLLAQADLRLHGDRLLDGRDRVLLAARLGAPHVHGRARNAAPRASS